MAFVQDHDRIASHRSPADYLRWTNFKDRTARLLRLALAGMVASKDYRHLNAMTDEQLGSIGLSRRNLTREIERRHFSDL